MRIISSLFILFLIVSIAGAESFAPPELYGTDACGRTIPDEFELKDFNGDRYVGIFYFLWLNLNQVFDNSQILKENPLAQKTNASPPWGSIDAFHFWGEPLFGYYRSDDPWILRRHAALLSDAGIDFVVFDTTNAVIYEDVIKQLCKIFEEQRILNESMPRVVFMVNTNAGETAQRIYELLYKPGLYPELWFYWKDKPLLICDPEKATPEVADFFTLRKAHWPFDLVNTHNEWHWEATYPQVFSYDEDPSKPEQVNVSVGQNLHQDNGKVEMMSTGKARGRSFHHGKVDVRPAAYKYGFNFEEQWQRAFELDPEVVFITGWNEWIAMQLNTKEGPAIFCDQYNREFSRDVEMDKNGYGDNYYVQMAGNIRRFKGMKKTSTISNQAHYQDHAMDTVPRDYPGCGSYHYQVNSGRNDFRELSVSNEEKILLFSAKTTANITPYTDQNWMWLLIDVRDRSLPDWEGFNYLVNRNVNSSYNTSLEICTGGWNWKQVGNASYKVDKNEIGIEIPKELLGIDGQNISIEFKWIDNSQNPGDIMDTYINGDAAPGGRFRYRFSSK